MSEKIRITVLVDNAAVRTDVQAEHGLSLWIEYSTKHILWDTGQSEMLLANAKTLGVDLTQTDVIVLSHGHYDHTGGLAAVRKLAPQVEVISHPAATRPRYSKKDTVHPVGMSPEAVQVLNAGPTRWIDNWAQIFPGVSATGPIPRENSYEDTGGAFFLDPECQAPDMLPDDQALALESMKGLIVILGCAHSGTVNTLDYICRKTGQTQIYAVIGGMHLGKASELRLASTVAAMRKYNVQCLIPLHCTGAHAAHYLQTALSKEIVPLPDQLFFEFQ